MKSIYNRVNCFHLYSGILNNGNFVASKTSDYEFYFYVIEVLLLCMLFYRI